MITILILSFFLSVSLASLLLLAINWWSMRTECLKLRIDMDTFVNQTKAKTAEYESTIKRSEAEIRRLIPYDGLANADVKAKEILQEAKTILQDSQSTAAKLTQDAQNQIDSQLAETKKQTNELLREARDRSKKISAEAQSLLDTATSDAFNIIEKSEEKAQQIAGKAYDALKNAELYEKTAIAMQNLIYGHGNQYLVPSHSLLDELAEHFGHTEAGERLKHARYHSQVMVENDTAWQCDYTEPKRKKMAGLFVLDAFNGKADSILSRVKHDNYGILAQEMKDACTLVNYNGKAFRDASITDAYLHARQEELRWAAIVQELKLKEKEEQRQIREKIREEEKARRDYERAIREAAKEEDMLRQAMAKAQAQISQATAEQRAKYEEQLTTLQAKLVETEAKNQRAISMAQQTRRGHVYVISNIGSFGENVYKIGMTRRLDPLDRVKELGDSSVPFEFDVHAMIYSDDCPALEHQLHKHFVQGQINKVNHRKEFFRANLNSIREEISSLGINAQWTMTAVAAEYRETQAIEELLKKDPSAMEAWANRQFILEVADEVEAAGVSSTEE